MRLTGPVCSRWWPGRRAQRDGQDPCTPAFKREAAFPPGLRGASAPTDSGFRKPHRVWSMEGGDGWRGQVVPLRPCGERPLLLLLLQASPEGLSLEAMCPPCTPGSTTRPGAGDGALQAPRGLLQGFSHLPAQALMLCAKLPRAGAGSFPWTLTPLHPQMNLSHSPPQTPPPSPHSQLPGPLRTWKQPEKQWHILPSPCGHPDAGPPLPAPASPPAAATCTSRAPPLTHSRPLDLAGVLPLSRIVRVALVPGTFPLAHKYNFSHKKLPLPHIPLCGPIALLPLL